MCNNVSILSRKEVKPVMARFAVIFCLLFSGLVSRCQSETLTVICNQNGVPTEMKLSELKSVLKGERQRWNSGTKVKIALMKTSTSIGKNTAQVIYNMSGDALLKFWLGQTYQGNAHAPKFFNTTSELESFVAENPGAIGIIDQAVANNDIKIIAIDGKTQFSL